MLRGEWGDTPVITMVLGGGVVMVVSLSVDQVGSG